MVYIGLFHFSFFILFLGMVIVLKNESVKHLFHTKVICFNSPLACVISNVCEMQWRKETKNFALLFTAPQ